MSEQAVICRQEPPIEIVPWVDKCSLAGRGLLWCHNLPGSIKRIYCFWCVSLVVCPDHKCMSKTMGFLKGHGGLPQIKPVSTIFD